MDGEKQDAKIKRYKITLLKKSHQSTKPSRIKENIHDLQCLQSLFQEIVPVIEGLNLSPELIQYYAQIVIKSRGFQMNRRENRRYLLLMAFVAYQYYRLNDILIEVLMQSVQTILNTSEREHKENFYNERKGHYQKLNRLAQKINNHLTTLKQIKEIVRNQTLSSDEKVNVLHSLFSKETEQDYVELQKQCGRLGKESTRIVKNVDFYDLLETKSIKLQNRVSEIVKNLQLDQSTSNKDLMQAIEYYKQKGGSLGNSAPIDFLEADEQEFLFNSKGKLRISLYKVLIFSKIADGIRSGALNFRYSYKYRAFENYLIPQKIWNSDKKALLDKVGLSEMEDFSKLEINLKQAV